MQDEHSGTGRSEEYSVIRETTYKRPPTREEEPATEAIRAELQDINATTVIMNRSGSERITAERVTMERSGTRTIEAGSAQLDRSGVVALGSDNAVLLHSQAVQVVADEARLNRSRVLALFSNTAHLENSRIFFYAGNAEGDVRTVFTPRTAAIFGGVLAAGLGAVMLVLRTLSGSDG